jgi:hypothetical protein
MKSSQNVADDTPTLRLSAQIAAVRADQNGARQASTAMNRTRKPISIGPGSERVREVPDLISQSSSPAPVQV